MSSDTAVRRTDFTLAGHAGTLGGYRWCGAAAPTWVAVLVHGYGEHLGRYEHVAARLAEAGAVVVGADHLGHGRSEGERVLITDFELVVGDVCRMLEFVRAGNPGLPVVLVGHSMGGLIGARFVQRHPGELSAAVLSGPVLGRWDPVTDLLALDEIPPTPIDPTTLSRDDAVGVAYAEDPLVWHGDFKRPTIEALALTLKSINAGGRLAVPTLWLHGGDDQLVPIEGTREGWALIRSDDSAEKVYPEARHEIFNETNQDEVLDDVLAFVRGHLPAS